MEKLIELLNEYEAKRHKTSVIANIRKGEDRLSYLEMNWNYSELLCISKGYEFIKRLVDNDKIKPLRKFIGWETDEDEPYIQFDLVDQYIAYLSIQDNPIEFLISVLR